MPNPSSPLLFFAAGALIGGESVQRGGGWYLWQRGRQEAAKRLREGDAIAAREGLENGIEIAALPKRAKKAGLDPGQVIAGYQQLRDMQVTPGQVLEALQRALITRQ